ILLVGAVSAFFYRHESPPARKLPALKTAAELDRQIAERQHVPYLPKEEPEADPQHVGIGSDSANIDESGGLVPEPIALDGELPESVFVSSQTAVTGSSREQFHIVRNGDTLSSIAQQYLGSTARYQDVYEANRDRLKTPNDLRIGQEIRIPIAAPVASAPAVTRMTQNDKPTRPTTSEPAAPASTDEGERRFVPFRGSPLTPGGKSPESSAAPTAPPSTAGRRLSQLPPKGDAVIR
ncbi:MAG TPA: LysM peptidoglycan-binding domain-containing protein, partial [Planctomycetaceae bacterium]|nr:LysM peptidoglycan-binding domain-containing protein [Planctomycetaceae bacterium]